MTNVQIVEQIYAAFGRGDVPAILEHVAEDCDWEYDVAPNDIPWLQRRRGRGEIVGFFASLAAVEFTEFVPRAIVAGPGFVVALVTVAATVKATGGKFREEHEMHLFWFDERGRVTRFKHGVDSLGMARAVAGG